MASSKAVISDQKHRILIKIESEKWSCLEKAQIMLRDIFTYFVNILSFQEMPKAAKKPSLIFVPSPFSGIQLFGYICLIFSTFSAENSLPPILPFGTKCSWKVH